MRGRSSRTARRRRKLSGRGVVFVFCVFLFVSLTVTLLIDAGIKPYTRNIAKLKAEEIAVLIVNETVEEILSEKSFASKELVAVEKDSSGKVSAVRTDALRVNLLKAKISRTAAQRISEIQSKRVTVSIGALTGSDFFSGRGPKVDLVLSLTGNVSCDVKNSFISAGYNQTLHRMMLTVKSKVYVFLPGNEDFTEISTEFCIAETVIVGTVPDFLRSSQLN